MALQSRPPRDETCEAALGALLLDSTELNRKREGFQFLRQSAKEGDAGGHYALAYCYEFGFGTAPDLKAAVGLYQQAAKAGNPDAMRSLAVLYYSDKGVQRDLSEAFKWNKRGCDVGHAPSCWSLGSMYLKGEGVSKNLVLAYAYIGVSGRKLTLADAFETVSPISSMPGSHAIQYSRV